MMEVRFILDNHLGKLAASLRMLGFDTLYRNDYQDDELAAIAEPEQRILLTRDRRLLMRKAIRRGYCVRQDDPHGQIRRGGAPLQPASPGAPLPALPALQPSPATGGKSPGAGPPGAADQTATLMNLPSARPATRSTGKARTTSACSA